ncbi:hypothetical protein HHI36_010091, partial [Cryptolaemus montrouzieri]
TRRHCSKDSMQNWDEDINEDQMTRITRKKGLRMTTSDSEQEFEAADVEGDLELGGNFQIYFGKDNETIWVHEPVAHTYQTMSKKHYEDYLCIQSVCSSIYVRA